MRIRFSLKYVFLALLTLSSIASYAADFADPEKRDEAVHIEARKPLTYFQLRNELMDFADRYMQMVGQASDTLQRKAKDTEGRVGIHSMKLFSTSAAFAIAADASPQMSLLDMVVLVHLQGTVWRETAPKRFGADAAILLKVQDDLEKDIDDIATRALSAEQLVELKKLVADWHAAHPEQRYVSYIRFSDFADMRRADWQRKSGANPFSIAGLLSTFQLVNVDEASRAVDQARQTGERAIYLTQRLPTLLRWQTEMLYYTLAATPESKNILDATASLKTFPERMTKGLILVAFVVFGLALLYKILSKKFIK